MPRRVGVSAMLARGGCRVRKVHLHARLLGCFCFASTSPFTGTLLLVLLVRVGRLVYGPG